MKKVNRFFFVYQLLFLFSLQALEQKPWTILVYMSAAHDFHSSALTDLKEIVKVGSGQDVNVLVYLTIQEKGYQKQTKKLFAEKGKLHQVGPVINRDSGDVAAFAEALQWAVLDYPSDHIAVILSGYSSGALNRKMPLLRGLCHDVESGNFLTDQDFFNALSWVCKAVRNGKKIDIMAGNASFLGSVEMAYTFSPFVDYFVSSEGEMVGQGLQYADILSALNKEALDPLSLAKLMVYTYGKECSNRYEYTLSAIDLIDMDLLVDNINAIAHVLLSHLKGKNNIYVKAAIKKSINKNLCTAFDDGVYIDLLQMYKNLLKNISALKLSKAVGPQFKETLLSGIALLSESVKIQAYGKDYKDLGGLSIYFSRHSIDPSYYGLHWTHNNPQWLNLLEGFLE